MRPQKSLCMPRVVRNLLTAFGICLMVFSACQAVSAADQDQELLLAAMKGDREKVVSLLDDGADINSRDQSGWTPLLWAISRGQTDIVKLLLEKDADVNARAARGWTALMEAANRGHLGTVKLLLDKGADASLRHEYGWTALSIAKGKGKTEIEALLKGGR